MTSSSGKLLWVPKKRISNPYGIEHREKETAMLHCILVRCRGSATPARTTSTTVPPAWSATAKGRAAVSIYITQYWSVRMTTVVLPTARTQQALSPSATRVGSLRPD